jgi:hypothetical protein
MADQCQYNTTRLITTAVISASSIPVHTHWQAARASSESGVAARVTKRIDGNVLSLKSIQYEREPIIAVKFNE